MSQGVILVEKTNSINIERSTVLVGSTVVVGNVLQVQCWYSTIYCV